MPNNFKTFTQRDIDATSTTVYTCPSAETTIIGLNIANILSVSITVTVELYDGGGSDPTHIVKDAIIPVGSSLVAVGGDQKIVMNATDILKVKGSQTDCCDVVLSVLEIS